MKNVQGKEETNSSRETLIISAASKKDVAVHAPTQVTRRLISILSWGGMNGLLLSKQCACFSIWSSGIACVPHASWPWIAENMRQAGWISYTTVIPTSSLQIRFPQSLLVCYKSLLFNLPAYFTAWRERINRENWWSLVFSLMLIT